MKIYLIRHGEVSHNALDQYNNEDEDLNEMGIIQAKDIRDNIKSIDYDIIISSPLIRAKHTSEIINVNNKETIIEKRLTERDPGSLSGQPISVTNRDEYWNYNTTIQYGTSENIKTFFNKVYEFLDDLKTKNYECVLIVAHSGVTKAFSSYFEGMGNGMFLDRGLKNCEIKEYEL
jgi:Fructose-2,6-bisphosphatase